MAYPGTIMAGSHVAHNRVKVRRLERGWSQGELARCAGISRAAVSAIEIGRLVPSVAAALGLAGVLDRSVEELFGGGVPDRAEPAWAWPAPRQPWRFWHASVGGRTLLFPAEPTPLGIIAHDGVSRDGECRVDGGVEPGKTLVMACCDPAAGLLAAEYARATGFRLLILPRSSNQALALLDRGLVHVAGAHLATAEDDGGNARAVVELVGEAACLLRVARWEEGLALAGGVAARSVRSTLRSDLAWVGREPGSGARRCLDRLRPGRPAPERVAHDHRGVAEAIRSGWAQVGVCLRLTGEEAGLRFLGIQVEAYDLCYPQRAEGDPRIQGLIRVVRSGTYRRLLGELPGYDASSAGDVERVMATTVPPASPRADAPDPP